MEEGETKNPSRPQPDNSFARQRKGRGKGSNRSGILKEVRFKVSL